MTDSPARQIDFYHLADDDFGAAAALLADKCQSAGHRLLILASLPVAGLISDALWTTRPENFLAHGTDDEPGSDSASVWISTRPDHNPGGADYLLLTAGLEMDDMGGFARVFNLFDGSDETALAKAREQWKSWSADTGWQCRYFARTAGEGWTQRA